MIRTGIEAMQFDRVHGWLTSSYWSPGIEREKVEKAAAGSSIVIGAFDGDLQVGYCRIISDRTTFGWVCDVFVDSEYRGRGIARKMVNYALQDVDHQGMRRWVLATADAHGVYAKLGFAPLVEPQRWMLRPGTVTEPSRTLP